MHKRIGQQVKHLIHSGPKNARVQEEALSQWYRTPMGQRLMAIEQQLVARALSGRFGSHLLQLDTGLHEPLFEKRLFGCGTLVSQLDNRAPCPLVLADAEALPFEPESIDALLMHHTLDHCENPYQALREAAQVLKPGGLLIIVGFNPFSTWGARAMMSRNRAGLWRSRFIRSGRVADWMQLLDFEIERHEKHVYSPPFNRPNWMTRLRVFGHMQRVVLPGTGAVYLMVGCKQVAGRINSRARWRVRPVLDSGLASRIIRNRYDD